MSDLERLWWYYAAGRLFIPKPRYLCYNSTLRCEQRCLHCGIWEDKKIKELTAEELKPVFSQPLFSRVETVWFTGGEPTIRKDLGELTELAVGSLPALNIIGLATNGIRTERVISRLKDMIEPLDRSRQGLFVHISLDGFQEVHDRIRGMEGAFDNILDTLDQIKKLDHDNPDLSMETGFNCVIQPGNVRDLANLYSFAKQREVSLTFNMVVVTDQIYRTMNKSEDLKFTAEERNLVIEFLKTIESDSLPIFRYQHRIIREVLQGKPRPRRCLTLLSTFNINADGAIIPCPMASDIFPENVIETDLEKLWQSDKARAMRKKIRLEFCSDCMLSCSLGDSMSLSDRLEGKWE